MQIFKGGYKMKFKRIFAGTNYIYIDSIDDSTGNASLRRYSISDALTGEVPSVGTT